MRLALCACLALGLTIAHGPAAERSQRYERREHHDPDGIGKFYMGREIAQVMGPGGAAWLERPERVREERPDLVLAALKVQPGAIVADLGAGSGYYTFRLASLVGPRGKVFAVDIEPRMLRLIEERARREDMANIAPLRSTTLDAKLPQGIVDLVLLVDAYHELEFPFEIMTSVARSLRPGGRLAIVEYRQEDPAVAIKAVHKMSEQQIIRELRVAGFRHVRTIGALPQQHLVIFQAARR